MPWMAAIFLGLLTGAMAAIYAGFVADLATGWLRISSFEGASGFFVVGMGLLGFFGGSVVGITVCRLLGGPGEGGALRGFGYAVLIVGGIISAAGVLAWLARSVPLEIGGASLELALELRLPPGAERPDRGTVVLVSGPGRRVALGDWRPEESREEDGRWILPGRVALHVPEADRVLTVGDLAPDALHFRIPVPARPAALDDAFGAWIAAMPVDGSTSAAEAGWEVRYRIVPYRPPPAEPPPPGAGQTRRAAFDALPPDAPTEALLGFVNAVWQDDVAADALRAASARPDFMTALRARLASPDHDAARDAMYLIGAMRPAPAEHADAVRARAAEVVRIAEAIDPAAEDSRDRLYAEAHTLSTGVVAAAFGLRRAGVDISPELRAMAAACRPREKAPPHAIADSAERVAAYVGQAAPEGL